MAIIEVIDESADSADEVVSDARPTSSSDPLLAAVQAAHAQGLARTDVRALEAAIEDVQRGAVDERKLEALRHVAGSLRVASVFGLREDERDAAAIAEETFWRSGCEAMMRLLAALLADDAAELPIDERVALFAGIARCLGDQDDRWHILSLHLLAKLGSVDVARHILSHDLRSLFGSHAHPAVHADSGRALPRPRGGNPHGSEYEDDQPWKASTAEALGCWRLLRECIVAVGADVERIWPLAMPPLLALIDDYDWPYRIRGLHALQPLLDRREAHVLLRRTGLGQLIRKSIATSITYLSEVSHAPLIIAALEADVQLIDILANGDDEWRFDGLCQLVIDGPMLAWRYSGEKVAFARVAADAVSLIVRRLGLGCVRFLPVFVPALTAILRFPSPSIGMAPLHLAHVRALAAIVQHARPRIARWRGDILGGVATCWVGMRDARLLGSADRDLAALEAAIVALAGALDAALPELRADVGRLNKATDGALEGLLRARG